MKKSVKIGMVFGIIMGIAGMSLILLLTPTGPTNVSWVFHGDGEFYYSTPVYSNDRVYIATGHQWYNEHGGSFPETGYLYCINATSGHQLWNTSFHWAGIRAGPVLAPSGMVFVIAEGHNATGYRTNHTLWAINADGSKNWSAIVLPDIPINLMEGDLPHSQQVAWSMGALALAMDNMGHVYAGGDSLYKFHAGNGTEAWRAETGSVKGGCIVHGSNIITGNATHLLSLHAVNGSVSWIYNAGGRPWYPAIGPTGEIVFGTSQGKVISLNADGATRWVYTSFTGQGTTSYPWCHVIANPAIDGDGNVYVGSKFNQNSEWVSLSPEGVERWKIATDDLRDSYSSPALGDDGNVYFCTEGSAYWIVDRATGTVETFTRGYFVNSDVTYSSSVIDGNGMQYVGTMDGRLFAIQTMATGLDPNAAWPCRGGGIHGRMAA